MNNEEQILTDTFGRKHSYLRISLTEKCNLRCTYCMPANGVLLSPKSDLMTDDEIYTIAKLFVKHGVTKIRLTGGEPLVRKDFVTIVENLATLNVSLSITTNGVLVDKHIQTLKDNKINHINFSLDTLVASKFKTITLRNQYEKVIENLHLLINQGFKVKINVVLIKNFNDDEIINFINLTQHLRVDIRFIEFMPFNGNQWDKSKMVSQAEILTAVNNHFSNTSILTLPNEVNFTARNYKVNNYLGNFGIISSITNPFCDQCNRIRLTANGQLKNCLFSNAETNLLSALRAGQPIEPIINTTIKNKMQKRAGMNTQSQINNPSLHFDNRSMITIGG